MTIHLATFASPEMSRSADLCVESAKRNGASIAHRYNRSDIEGWAEKNGVDLNARGCGFWAWKPAIILETMNKLGQVDAAFDLSGQNILIYADAGVEFIGSVNYIIDRMDQDIFLFGNMYEHAHWCKRDVVNEIWRFSYPLDDLLWSQFGKQAQASVIFFRVNDKMRAFVKEWLDWCLFEGGRLIDDSPSRTPNHPEFQENRHDQAILTTMAYRDGIKLHYWPAQYNDGAFEYPRGDYPDEGYPVLFHHHRGVKTGERTA